MPRQSDLKPSLWGTTRAGRLALETRTRSQPDVSRKSEACKSTLDGERGWAEAGVLLFWEGGGFGSCPSESRRDGRAGEEKTMASPVVIGIRRDGGRAGKGRRAGLAPKRSDRPGGKGCAYLCARSALLIRYRQWGRRVIHPACRPACERFGRFGGPSRPSFPDFGWRPSHRTLLAVATRPKGELGVNQPGCPPIQCIHAHPPCQFAAGWQQCCQRRCAGPPGLQRSSAQYLQ